MHRKSALKALFLIAAAAAALNACNRKDAASVPAPVENPVVEEATAPDYAAIAAAAVADPARPAEDRADDARRKPAEALEFFQVAPGMSVFEIEAGGGWYTELLSHAVGANGSVVMQNPERFRSFLGDKVDVRLKDDRLSNVRYSDSNFDRLDAPDGGVDLVTWVQGPHELYFHPEEGVSFGDPATSYAEIFRVLKPGGAFVVIDHSAEVGAPETSGNDLHRIDKAIVKSMAESAGFTLDAESSFLANPADPLAITVFDASIRGHTDQFALRFRKPS
jgi:predicted methyltransferase